MISVSNREWGERKFNENLVNKCSQDNNFSQILSKLIVTRNFIDDEIYTINNSKNVNFSNFFKFNKDFTESIDLVIKNIKNKSKICILGDYDVDGSCATALLIRFLKSINQPLFFYIPDRIKDGYGPSIKLFKKIINKSPKLIIMVDCGSTSIDAINYLNENNIDSLIIDHHQINKPFPKANSIINPKKDNGYIKYDYMCATSLTYFFLDLLIDKLNIHFKGGPLENVQFTEAEKPFVDKMAELETWGDVEQLTEELWEYAKENEQEQQTCQDDSFMDQYYQEDEEEEEDSDEENDFEYDFNETDSQDQSKEETEKDDCDKPVDKCDNEGTDGDQEEDQKEEDNGDQESSQSEADEEKEEEGEKLGGERVGGYDKWYKDDPWRWEREPKSLTDQNFREHEEELVHEDALELKYYNSPTIDLKSENLKTH